MNYQELVDKLIFLTKDNKLFWKEHVSSATVNIFHTKYKISQHYYLNGEEYEILKIKKKGCKKIKITSDKVRGLNHLCNLIVKANRAEKEKQASDLIKKSNILFELETFEEMMEI